MKLSLGQAAKEVGLDKSTISRAIQRGKLSAQRQERGGYEIDPAELFRVFPPASHKPPVISPPRDIPPETLVENREEGVSQVLIPHLRLLVQIRSG
jgi:hypothetical protein